MHMGKLWNVSIYMHELISKENISFSIAHEVNISTFWKMCVFLIVLVYFFQKGRNILNQPCITTTSQSEHNSPGMCSGLSDAWQLPVPTKQ